MLFRRNGYQSVSEDILYSLCTVFAMSGGLKETKLAARGARQQLKRGTYWRLIDAGTHLGFRKLAAGGEWLVRWYIGGGNYHRATIGPADDHASAGSLSYDEAAKRGRELVAERRANAKREAQGAGETVRQAVESYVAMRDARLQQQRPGTKQRSDAASRLTKYVLCDPIADIGLVDLCEDDLIKWKKRAAPYRSAGSRVRTINDFRAALNLTHRRLRRQLPADFAASVRWGLSIEKMVPVGYKKARDNQILDDDTVRDIVAAASAYDRDGDVGRMVLLLAATGARFSQLARLTVGDVQADRQRIFIPLSRKGQGKADAHYPIRVGDDVMDALRPVLSGRSYDEPLLCRWRMKQVRKQEGRGLIWVPDYRGPWTSAAELTRQFRKICERSGHEGTIPYALRHSSIVRAIRAGLPIRLVAAMHDTSVEMIERHYSRFIVDGLEELTARAIVPIARRRLRAVA